MRKHVSDSTVWVNKIDPHGLGCPQLHHRWSIFHSIFWVSLVQRTFKFSYSKDQGVSTWDSPLTTRQSRQNPVYFKLQQNLVLLYSLSGKFSGNFNFFSTFIRFEWGIANAITKIVVFSVLWLVTTLVSMRWRICKLSEYGLIFFACLWKIKLQKCDFSG